MVDELVLFPTTIRCFKSGSCHLTTDGDVEELHAFARRLSLKREWYQPHRVANHYDLTAGKRDRALSMGAVFVPMRQQIANRRAVVPKPHPMTKSDKHEAMRARCEALAGFESLTSPDKEELRRFEAYLARRAEHPEEPAFQAYAEVYGDVVFEDALAAFDRGGNDG